MATPVFDEIERECILQWIALGFTPSQIVEFVNQDFGKKCSRQNIHNHKTDHAEEIARLRAEIKANLQCIPFANKEVRVANLDRAARELLRRRNYTGFAQILKQIAEETGQLVQKHEHRVDTEPDLSAFTLEELEQMQAIHEAANARRDQPGTGPS